MPSYWPLLLGSILILLVMFILLKKIFPGVSYAALRKMKLNAEALGSIPLLTLSIDRSGVIRVIHSIPSDFTDHIHPDLHGRNCCIFIHKDFHQDFISALERASFSGSLHNFQYSLKTDSGMRWYQGGIVKTSETLLLLTVKEVTESKITGEKLDMVHHFEDMTTFILDEDSMTITFDREDFVSKWSGRKIPKVVNLKEVMDLFSPENVKILTEALNRITFSDEDFPAVKVEFAQSTDLQSNWVTVKGFGISRDSTGKASTILGVIRDITDSVRVEDQLKNLNLMLKNVLDTIPVGLYWKDENLQYQGASRVFLNDTRVESVECLDDDFWITERSRQIEQQIITTGKSILNRQEKFLLQGSMSRTVNISRVPLRSPSGAIIGLMVAYVDETENIQIRDQLIRRKEFLSGLVDNLPVGFFAKDPSTGMTYRIWNREMEEIFGLTASEAVEQRDWNLFGTKAAALLRSDDDALMADPDSGKAAKVYKLRGRNGLRTVSIVRVLLYDDLLDSTLVAGVVDDITRESELEDQLRQAQKMEAIGRLAGGVAHDFNNLLQVMMGSAEIGINSTSPAEKSFNQILQAGEKAMFLTRQLLSFSRDDSYNKRVFSLDHRVGEFVRMVHRIIGENSRLEFTPGASEARINGDPFQLEQVLMNLLVNARDAIPDGTDGLINVETSTSKVSCFAGRDPVDCVVVSVSDTGEGIPEDNIDKIFEPFFTTKAQGKGTGLGLASSYGIVAKHDGVILVESTIGEGTRFDVCIPVYHGDLTNTVKKQPLETEDEAVAPLTILLAEDEEMVREIAKTILETAGHTVIEAENGEEAVELFLENQDVVDLLIFDAIMPVLSGSEAYGRIHAVASDIPVLFCTGYSRDSLTNAFAGDEKADVLQKPYAAADLLEALKNLKHKK